jgi:hypothetical protein
MATTCPDPILDRTSGAASSRRDRLHHRHGDRVARLLPPSAIAVAIYIAICAVISAVATVLMTDCAGRDISGEYRAR